MKVGTFRNKKQSTMNNCMPPNWITLGEVDSSQEHKVYKETENLNRPNLTRLNHKKRENLNRPIRSKQIESVTIIKKKTKPCNKEEPCS